MTERREGWYWVRHKQDRAWVVAEKKGDWFFGEDFQFSAIVDAFEIGPRIPSPDEPWQCVPVEPTREMLESTGDNSASAYHGMLGAWTLMLAAAPKPEDG